MSDFERALEAELLAAARRRTVARGGVAALGRAVVAPPAGAASPPRPRAVRRRGAPTVLLATALAGAVAAFAGVPALVATDTVTPSAITAPPCSAQESLLGAGPCTSDPFSSLSP